MPDGLPSTAWEVRQPWRRFAREWFAATLWFVVVAALLRLAGGENWMVVLLALAAAYVLGPLVVPASFEMDSSEVRRKSRFGERRFPWSEFAGFSLGRGERAAYLHRRGGWVGRVRGSVTLWLPEESDRRREVLALLRGHLSGSGAEKERGS